VFRWHEMNLNMRINNALERHPAWLYSKCVSDFLGNNYLTLLSYNVRQSMETTISMIINKKVLH